MSFENVPSKNAADEAGGLAGALRSVLAKHSQSLDGQLPATVIAYDAAANVVTVRPDISVVGMGGSVTPRAQVARVPALSLGAGGFTIRFPIQPGDRGWIEASDRDISLYIQAQSGPVRPNTNRVHSFSDGRFIPDTFADAVISGEDMSAVTLQSFDGSVKIALDPEGVRIDAPLVTIDSPVVFKQTTRFEGRMTGIDGMTVNDIPYETHRHIGVDTGPGTSGVPTA